MTDFLLIYKPLKYSCSLFR